MDKLADLELEENESNGLFSKADAEDIDKLHKAKSYTEFNLLCNKLCFPDYKQSITPSERDCHEKCFKTMHFTLLYCQRKLAEANMSE